MRETDIVKTQQEIYKLIKESWPLIKNMIGEPDDAAYKEAFDKACEWQVKMVMTPREYSTLTAMEQAKYQFSMLLIEMMEVCDRLNKTLDKMDGGDSILRGCVYESISV